METLSPGAKPWNANSGWYCINCVARWIAGSPGNWGAIFDREILLVYFWAVLHDRPTSWACRRDNWPPGLWPRVSLPTQATVSRRLATTEVQRLMQLLEEVLRQQHPDVWVRLLDGKPLTVGCYSHDPDAAWGQVGHGFAKGYKLHAVYGSAAVPLSWEVTPLNRREPEVAVTLLTALPGEGYVLGDKAYDSNPLHEVASACGQQLVAQRKLPQRGWGHRPQTPGRLRSAALLQTDFGKALYHHRDAIERQFAWLTNHAGGLPPLPNWVRRLHRVRAWVQAKLIIHAIYAERENLPPLLAVA